MLSNFTSLALEGIHMEGTIVLGIPCKMCLPTYKPWKLTYIRIKQGIGQLSKKSPLLGGAATRTIWILTRCHTHAVVQEMLVVLYYYQFGYTCMQKALTCIEYAYLKPCMGTQYILVYIIQVKKPIPGRTLDCRPPRFWSDTMIQPERD